MADEPAGEAEVLRIAIQGGGCSGFEYALGFDRGAQAGDHELEFHGVKVVVDPFSAPYLQGSTIDFLERLQESGFKIENPNATSSCGCGHSFQVADGEEQPEDAAGCGRLRLSLSARASGYARPVSARLALPSSAPARPASTRPTRC